MNDSTPPPSGQHAELQISDESPIKMNNEHRKNPLKESAICIGYFMFMLGLDVNPFANSRGCSTDWRTWTGPHVMRSSRVNAETPHLAPHQRPTVSLNGEHAQCGGSVKGLLHMRIAAAVPSVLQSGELPSVGPECSKASRRSHG